MSVEWKGNRWAGDTHYGHCSACGKPATRRFDGGWWHSYATHIVECHHAHGDDAEFVYEGAFDA